MEEDNTIGGRVRRARKALKLRQEDVEALSGVDQSTLSNIEKRNVVPQSDTLIRLARALRTSAEFLYDGQGVSWPFEFVAMERVMALDRDLRIRLEGRLEEALASIETNTSGLGKSPIQNLDPVTDEPQTQPLSSSKKTVRSRFNTQLTGAGAEKGSSTNEVGQSGKLPKPRSNRGSKGTARRR